MSRKFNEEALSRREQRGWSAARASAGPHIGPETSPNQSEAARCEQAKRDNVWRKKIRLGGILSVVDTGS